MSPMTPIVRLICALCLVGQLFVGCGPDENPGLEGTGVEVLDAGEDTASHDDPISPDEEENNEEPTCPVEGSVSVLDESDIAALAGCTNIPRDLEIQASSLTDLGGLESLVSVGGALLIKDNAALGNLDGLSSLIQVGNDLVLGGNTSLTNLDGLDNLSSLGGDLTLHGNNQLTDLEGLNNLASIGGRLSINGDNRRLTDLAGLRNLSSVGSDVWLNRVRDLEGLSNLTSIGGDLIIEDNDFLTDLDTLNNLETIGSDEVIVINNRVLPQCQAEALAQRLGVDCFCEGNNDAGVCD